MTNQVLDKFDFGEHSELASTLITRIMILNERVWESKILLEELSNWLLNFNGESGITERDERFHMLFLLSQFMYFGTKEMRVLLRSLYRDLYLTPLVRDVRSSLGGTRDLGVLNAKLETEKQRTRFLGVGNPSESGVHLLYYFRQENDLSKSQFLASSDIFGFNPVPDPPNSTSLPSRYQATVLNPKIARYVFIDDVCGSGDTVKRNTESLLGLLHDVAPKASVHYYALFGTVDGLNYVRNNTWFGENCAAVFELDETYKSLEPQSRFLRVLAPGINPKTLEIIVNHYGSKVWEFQPRGFGDSQLLLGFHHNTPDNTLPIFWADQTNVANCKWNKLFRRYMKYGYGYGG